MLSSKIKYLFMCVVTAVACLVMADFAISGGDRPMEGPLVLRVGQVGFAGITGTEYRLQPNGQWRAMHFVNERLTDVVGEGQLPTGKMIELSHRLRQTDLTRVQEEMSASQSVNPVVVEIRYGDETAAASLQAGYSLDEPCPTPENAVLCEFLELTRNIQAAFQHD